MDLKAISTIRVYLIHKVGPCLATLRIINRKDSLQTWFDLNLLRLWFERSFFLLSIECSLLDQCFIAYAFLFQAVYLILSDFFISFILCVIHIHKLSLFWYIWTYHRTSSSSSGYSILLVPIAHSFSWPICCISCVFYKQVNYRAVAGLLKVLICKWQVDFVSLNLLDVEEISVIFWSSKFNWG